jgi:HlyD family secretion protein
MIDRHDGSEDRLPAPDEAVRLPAPDETLRLAAPDEAGDAAPPTQWSKEDAAREAQESRQESGSEPKEPAKGEQETTAKRPAPAAQPGDGEGAKPDTAKQDAPGVPRTAIIVTLVVVAALLGWGAYEHWRQNSDAAQTQNRTTQFIPTVRTVVAKREDQPIETLLPGQTEAFQIANIFARATGYISDREVDIGNRVKKGDLLVHIAAPDLDQQLAQAVAQLGQVEAALNQAQAQVTQATANLSLQKTNLQRTNDLTQRGFETVQNQQTQQTTVQSNQSALETATAGVKVAEANVRAQQASVDRLRALAQFEDVVAPFDGVVTARNVEVGDLLNADAGSGTPMFTVEEDDVLRVSVHVPQYSSAGIRNGLEAKVTSPEIPGRTFSGKVARSSVALLYSTRTLTVQVDVPNPDRALRAGLFVDVAFEVPRTQPNVSIPSDALIFDQHGARVAVVGEGDQIKMNKIDIYRDLGTSLELKNGLSGGEKVVVDPPADLRDGSKVKVAPDDEQKKDAANNGAAK